MSGADANPVPAGPIPPARLVRRGGIGVGTKLGALGLQTLHFALLARAIDTSTFGSLMAGLALLTILGALAELGLTSASVLALSEGEDEGVVVRSTLRASAALVSSSLVIALVATVVLLRGDARLAVVVLLPWFALSKIDIAFIAAHQHNLRIARIGMADLASRAVLVASVLPLLVWGEDWSSTEVLVVVGLGFLVSELVSLAVVAPGVTRHGELPPGAARALTWRAMPIGMTNASSLIHARSDQVLLDTMGRQAGLASYAVASRINEALLALANAAGTVTFPVTARARGEERRQAVRRFARLACMAGAGAAMVVFVVAPALLTILGGREFRSSSDLARILVVGLAVSVANMPIAQMVIADGLASRLLRLSVAAAIMNIVLTILLVVHLNEQGAALATSISEVVGFLAVALLAHSARPGCVPWSTVVLLPVVVVGGCWGGMALWRAGLEPAGALLLLAALGLLCGVAAFDPGGGDPITRWRSTPAVGSSEP